MDKQLQTLLEELYRLDPALRSHEKTLKPLIQELLASKPDIHVDPSFQKHLHTLIQERLSDSKEESGSRFSFLNLFSMNKFQYSLAGVAVASVLLVPIAYNFLSTPSFQFSDGSITTVENEAFGPLTFDDNLGKGGGGQAVTTSDTENSEPIEDDTEMALTVDNTSIVPWPMVNINYNYAGDPLTLDATSVDVLKRVMSDDLGQEFGNLFQSMDLDLINLSAFEDMKVTYLNLSPVDGEGYSVNLDLVSDGVSIYQVTQNNQWKWTPLTEADMLSDEQLLAIAEDFVNKYDLPMEGYGEPSVIPYDTTWGYPETVTVNYPILIEGEPVYEVYGTPTGINVSVSMRDDVVTDVWGMQTQNFQSSAYAASTDSAQILEVASHGGIYGFYYDEPTQTVDVTLGTPTASYMHYTMYDGETGKSQELFVPALIFPVTDKPMSVEGLDYVPYIQDQIVVPLATDLLEMQESPVVLF